MKKRKYNIRERVIIINGNIKGIILSYYEENEYWRYDVKHLFGMNKRDIFNYPEWDLKRYKKKN
uniref:Uncharacterized protein n=1 Tax=viral metagenome TaxID=1070528 RepID=A0A6M3LLD7_9ZZZZ